MNVSGVKVAGMVITPNDPNRSPPPLKIPVDDSPETTSLFKALAEANIQFGQGLPTDISNYIAQTGTGGHQLLVKGEDGGRPMPATAEQRQQLAENVRGIGKQVLDLVREQRGLDANAPVTADQLPDVLRANLQGGGLITEDRVGSMLFAINGKLNMQMGSRSVSNTGETPLTQDQLKEAAASLSAGHSNLPQAGLSVYSALFGLPGRQR